MDNKREEIANYHLSMGQEISEVELNEITKKKEYIICSAVWYKDLPLVKPEILEPRGFRPYNVDRGVVMSGWRHMNCIYQMCAITGLRDIPAQVGESIQGFLTNTNRFVDREEGYDIAESANQLNDRPRGGGRTLYSEDLY
jgi:hypothetical protein